MKQEKRICPKCGSKCNCIDFTPNITYIFCFKCNYQTWEPKYKMRNGLIHTIKELYKE